MTAGGTAGAAPDLAPPLRGSQMAAVAPEDSVWLSASAGTGKTHVLTSRVLRLLLEPGVSPSQILCLTFTKAGAAEMAGRINQRLAGWVRAGTTRLAGELKAIDADFGPASLERARTLFAAVLDCPGGGLRIDTIHAFSQWLLGAFPEEARLAPGTRAMEDAERSALLRRVLADLLVRAEAEPLGDPQLIAAMGDLSLRLGPDGVEAYLLRCALARDAWFGPGAWQEPMRPRINRLLGLPADADAGTLAAACRDDRFDLAALRGCQAIARSWTVKTGQDLADGIARWLALEPPARADALGTLSDLFFTKSGKRRETIKFEKRDPAFAAHADAACAAIEQARAVATLLALADRLVPALRLGRAFALAWDEAKRRDGLIDFDDQIRLAADLLTNSAYAQWIGYKLDRRFDHILVDEAQDTNAAQWRIIGALTQEFLAGVGQRGDLVRTLFVVGDYKQAIFGFQGTSPENFAAARVRVADAMAAAAENALGQRSNLRPRRLRELGLERSFRSAQQLLSFVDATIAELGHETLGLPAPADPHVGDARPGYVALWRPVAHGEGGAAGTEADDGGGGDDEDPVESDGEAQDEGEGGGAGGESWLSRADRRMADNIARQVRRWLDQGFTLFKGERRRANAGDVMVLVRKRRELAALIVARLHAAGVPVAGVDRLRLAGPLVVRDLMAALRFAAQPLDDLNLACLLTSPLIGWSQEQLLAHGWREPGVRLWEHLRRAGHAASHTEAAAVLARLGELLRRADYEPPQALLHWLLVGPWRGRAALVARLGREAEDPIDELLNSASAFAARAVPSLIGFIAAFDAGAVELKREPGGGEALVRVMTVHAAKGLQAPIVILADAAGDPAGDRDSGIDLPDVRGPDVRGPDAHASDRAIPLPPLRKAERVGRIAQLRAAMQRAERQEHWRLFYVAMTRAEEALFIGGALERRRRDPVEDSWFARARRLFGADDWVEDPVWGSRLDWGTPPPPHLRDGPAPAQLSLLEGSAPSLAQLPPWLEHAAGAEPRPPRPLVPSSLGEDETADPPSRSDAARGGDERAARRGVLVHRLLERLPEAPVDQRGDLGARWLARNAADLAVDEREALLADALAVIADPRWAELFGPAALAEVPIAALAGTRVVTGTIDRLLIEPGRIRLVDFKTARRPPLTIAQVPRGIVRQLAAYVLALEGTYPGRVIDAALLYTAAPRLIALPPDLLASHKRALLAAD